MEFVTKNNLKVVLLDEDITLQDTDAIVNAANNRLGEGGGVCGAIFRAAGAYQLQEECDEIINKKGRVKVGGAEITKGYNLKAKYIIHAVGPDLNRYPEGFIPEEDLANAYLNSLKLADEYNLTSISFPSISTGIYRYPKELASMTAMKIFVNYKPKTLQEVRMCLKGNKTLKIYEDALKENL